MNKNLLTILIALAMLGCGGGDEVTSPAPEVRHQPAYLKAALSSDASPAMPHGAVNPDELAHSLAPPTLLAQANGNVVVVYQRVRRASLVDLSHPDAHQQHVGLYFQRLTAAGALLQPEAEVMSMLRFAPGGRRELTDLRTLALSDGGFVVSWGVAQAGGLGANQVDFFMRRFDSSGVPASEVLVPVPNFWCANRHLNSTFEWDADAAGGFSVSGTVYPKQFDGEQPCGGYGPPVQKNVYAYYAGAVPPSAAAQARRKACIESADGLSGDARTARIAQCPSQ